MLDRLKTVFLIGSLCVLSASVLAGEKKYEAVSYLPSDANALFKGFESTCVHSKVLDDYFKYSCTLRHPLIGKTRCEANREAFLPSKFVQIESTKISDEDGWFRVSTTFKPNSLLWHGMTVVSLQNLVGDENGNNGNMLVLKETSVSHVKDVLRADGVVLSNNVGYFVDKNKLVNVECVQPN